NCDTGPEVEAWSRYDAARVALWKGYYDTVQAKAPGAYAILEHLSENSEEKELAAYGMLFWGNMSYNYQEAAMGYIGNSNLEYGLYSARGWAQPHLITYMESHDEERIVFKNINYGASSGNYNIRDTATALKRMELAATLFLAQPGPKMIWQFGELGYHFPINYCEDGTINNACRVAPKPIRWDFTTDPRRKSVYHTYRRMLQLRAHPSFRNAFLAGTTSQSLAGAVKWLQLNTDSSRMLVVGNFDVVPQTATVTFAQAGTWYGYLDSTTFTATGSAQNIILQPGEYRVYLNRNVHQLANTPVRNVPGGEAALQASAFPNPVASSCTIAFTLPRSGTVQLDLVDNNGRVLRQLQSRFYPRGTHRAVFSRKELTLVPGIYFIRLRTGEQTKTISLIF
ncbi:MAG TPA: T9SS type A sorting domain-containing protein, partial [Chitinophagaceae bacterium]|nr:T9SS type A sorting domain-containing protein [Chitinophagaceae bacterium]